MDYKYSNFIDEKYKELQATEQAFFKVTPAPMGAIKKGIQIAAVPAVAAAATHTPMVGPMVAGAVSQATHFMHSGMHGIAADRISSHFTELASQVPHGWMRQTTFDAWAKVRSADMLAKTDAWIRPLSGIAAPSVIGKGIVDTGKFAFTYAAKGVPVAVARPVVQMWKMTNHYIDRTKTWLAEMQKNVQQTIEKLQGRQTAMADTKVQGPSPIEPDMDRRADYARLLSDYNKDPSLSYEQIEQNIQGKPDLATTYDEHVVVQALREGKDVDEATAIVANGPSVTEMSEENLQKVSPHLTETTNSALEQYNSESSSKEAEDSLLESLSALDQRGVDTSRMAVFYNNKQIFGMKGGDIDRSVTKISDQQMDDIKEALTNFKDFEGEFKVKVGSRVVLHLKEGQKLVDTYGIVPREQRAQGEFKTKDQLKEEQSTDQPKPVVDPRIEKVKQQGGNVELAQKYLNKAEKIAKAVSNKMPSNQPEKEPALVQSQPEI